MLRVQLLITPDPILSLFGNRSIGCHGNDGIAHQSRFRLPHRFKAFFLGISGVIEAITQIMRILQVERHAGMIHVLSSWMD